ncbi:ABC transporter permease [Paenibacillus soyae]|uniref:ABC transporter permease n=1 Tax=Paenibacillus soyae TaxID=2969249 RepID=A0A9X2MKY8_9BACL|nr:ABC transporter permease [Paenibacillus soyae]MCR2803863.1 ABC transporter permease [Paenibacillus soyae]
MKEKKPLEALRSQLPLLVFALLAAGIWEIGPPLAGMPHYIIPRLSDVLVALWEDRLVLLRHFGVTLWESVLGLALSALLGVLTAVWIDLSRLAERTVFPVIVASQTIPIVAISPIMVMWFGYELGSKVAVVMLFTFFPIAVNTSAGFRGADPDTGDLLRTMGASKPQLFLKWKLPSAMPGFFTGLKLGAAISVGGATLGEWLGGQSGLGMYTKRASNMLSGDAVFAGVLLLSFMGIGLFVIVWWIECMLLAHRRA